MPRAKLSRLMDAETWMNANKAKEYGFCDEIMYLSPQEIDEQPGDSYAFSRRAVTNSLLDKVKTKMTPPEPRVKATDLEKRLSLLK